MAEVRIDLEPSVWLQLQRMTTDVGKSLKEGLEEIICKAYQELGKAKAE